MGFGRKKIELRRIEKESSRMVTFSKRKKGLFKKAEYLQSKNGSAVAIIVFSPAGKPYLQGDSVVIDSALKTLLEGSATTYGSTTSQELPSSSYFAD